MAASSFKTNLKSGGTLLGTFLQIPSADVTEIVGRAGFDFGIIDLEHGMFGVDSAIQLIRACDVVGMTSVIRVPNVNPHSIAHALDFGASAVMVPMIQTRQDAEQVVNAAKFNPLGNRGVCPFVRSASYDSQDDTGYYKRANAETAILFQIEGDVGIANLDDILEVPYIDGILIGPYDLSQSLGIPGEINDIRVIKAFTDVIKRVKQKGIAVGNFAVTMEQAHKYIDMGVQFLAYGTDTSIMARTFKDLRRCILR